MNHIYISSAIPAALHYSKLHIVVAEDHNELIGGRGTSRILLSYLMQQSRSSGILVKSQRVDLAQKCFPTRHHHLITVEFDRDIFICDLAEQMGGRRLACLPWPALGVTRLALLEPTSPRWIPIPSCHLGYPAAAFSSAMRRCQWGPKRRVASVIPINSYSMAPRASGAK